MGMPVFSPRDWWRGVADDGGPATVVAEVGSAWFWAEKKDVNLDAFAALDWALSFLVSPSREPLLRPAAAKLRKNLSGPLLAGGADSAVGVLS